MCYFESESCFMYAHEPASCVQDVGFVCFMVLLILPQGQYLSPFGWVFGSISENTANCILNTAFPSSYLHSDDRQIFISSGQERALRVKARYLRLFRFCLAGGVSPRALSIPSLPL